jgi:hypothetical protein
VDLLVPLDRRVSVAAEPTDVEVVVLRFEMGTRREGLAERGADPVGIALAPSRRVSSKRALRVGGVMVSLQDDPFSGPTRRHAGNDSTASLAPLEGRFLGLPEGWPLRFSPENAVSDPARTACSELPNDNPGLHRGALCFVAEVIGSPVFEHAQVESPLPVPGPQEDQLKELPTDEEPSITGVATPTDPVPPMSEAEEDGDGIEIVDELTFDDAIDESTVGEGTFDAIGESMVDAPAAPVDPFAMLVSVIEDVARTAGADDEAMATLARLLGRARLEDSGDPSSRALRAEALAWQGILRSESDDFGACGGAMLDEWCGALIASVMGRTARADVLKRELRRRGVAAFGLVEQAA